MCRKPGDIARDAYPSSYKRISNDGEEHVAAKHFGVEGRLEFLAVLSRPKRSPVFNGT
jgi:hypothetical protein